MDELNINAGPTHKIIKCELGTPMDYYGTLEVPKTDSVCITKMRLYRKDNAPINIVNYHVDLIIGGSVVETLHSDLFECVYDPDIRLPETISKLIKLDNLIKKSQDLPFSKKILVPIYHWVVIKLHGQDINENDYYIECDLSKHSWMPDTIDTIGYIKLQVYTKNPVVLKHSPSINEFVLVSKDHNILSHKTQKFTILLYKDPKELKLELELYKWYYNTSKHIVCIYKLPIKNKIEGPYHILQDYDTDEFYIGSTKYLITSLAMSRPLGYADI